MTSIASNNLIWPQMASNCLKWHHWPQMASNDINSLKWPQMTSVTLKVSSCLKSQKTLKSLKNKMCVSCYPTIVETHCSIVRYIEIHFPRSIFKFHTCVLEKAKLILCIFDKLAIILHHRIEVCCSCFCSNISGLGQPCSCHLSCLVDPQNKIFFVLCRNKFVLYTT